MSWSEKTSSVLNFYFYRESLEDKKSLISSIRGAGELQPEEALEHYRETYYSSLADVLESQFPATMTLIENICGEDELEKLLSTYAKDHPSQEFNLSVYGRELINKPEYFPKFNSTQMKQLQELMRYEIWYDDMNRILYPPEDFSPKLYEDSTQKWQWAPYKSETFELDVIYLEEEESFLAADQLSPSTVHAFQTPSEIVTTKLSNWREQFLKIFNHPKSLAEAMDEVDLTQKQSKDLPEFFQFLATNKLLIPYS